MESQLRDSFRHIAQVEMHHLDLLGQTITALGGNPIYRSFPYKRPSFWNACMLQYQCNKEKALRISIAGEQEAIDGYHLFFSVHCQPHLVRIQNACQGQSYKYKISGVQFLRN